MNKTTLFLIASCASQLICRKNWQIPTHAFLPKTEAIQTYIEHLYQLEEELDRVLDNNDKQDNADKEICEINVAGKIIKIKKVSLPRHRSFNYGQYMSASNVYLVNKNTPAPQEDAKEDKATETTTPLTTQVASTQVTPLDLCYRFEDETIRQKDFFGKIVPQILLPDLLAIMDELQSSYLDQYPEICTKNPWLVKLLSIARFFCQNPTPFTYFDDIAEKASQNDDMQLQYLRYPCVEATIRRKYIESMYNPFNLFLNHIAYSWHYFFQSNEPKSEVETKAFEQLIDFINLVIDVPMPYQSQLKDEFNNFATFLDALDAYNNQEQPISSLFQFKEQIGALLWQNDKIQNSFAKKIADEILAKFSRLLSDMILVSLEHNIIKPIKYTRDVDEDDFAYRVAYANNVPLAIAMINHYCNTTQSYSYGNYPRLTNLASNFRTTLDFMPHYTHPHDFMITGSYSLQNTATQKYDRELLVIEICQCLLQNDGIKTLLNLLLWDKQPEKIRLGYQIVCLPQFQN